MNTTDFTFRLTSYDIERLRPQVHAALEERMEQRSRKQFPSLWNLIDRLNTRAAGKDRSRLPAKLCGIFFLAAGIFLLVPGLMDPQKLRIPLVAGIIGVIAGIAALWRGRKRKKDPFARDAEILLKGKDSLSAEDGIEVSFFATAMMLPGGGEDDCILYEDFQCVIETADLFVPVFGTRALVLQKCDLVTGSTEDFRAFLSTAVSQYCILA